jgi:hypothetical protein
LKYLPEHDYVPHYKDQKGVDFRFYQTLSTNPKYVTDDGCELIGSLYFEYPKRTAPFNTTIPGSIGTSMLRSGKAVLISAIKTVDAE